MYCLAINGCSQIIIHFHHVKCFVFYRVLVPLPGYDRFGRKVIIDISSAIDIDAASLEERQRVAMMTMDMAFKNPDNQVL